MRVNIHGLFSVANASIIEKQNIEGDHSDTPMDTESSSKNQGRDEELVCKLVKPTPFIILTREPVTRD